MYVQQVQLLRQTHCVHVQASDLLALLSTSDGTLVACCDLRNVQRMQHTVGVHRCTRGVSWSHHSSCLSTLVHMLCGSHPLPTTCVSFHHAVAPGMLDSSIAVKPGAASLLLPALPVLVLLAIVSVPPASSLPAGVSQSTMSIPKASPLKLSSGSVARTAPAVIWMAPWYTLSAVVNGLQEMDSRVSGQVSRHTKFQQPTPHTKQGLSHRFNRASMLTCTHSGVHLLLAGVGQVSSHASGC